MGIRARLGFARWSTVRADQLVVGDVVVLPTEHGDIRLQVDSITVRARTIKFVSRRVGGGDWGWGWPPDHEVTRLRRVGRRRR